MALWTVELEKEEIWEEMFGKGGTTEQEILDCGLIGGTCWEMDLFARVYGEVFMP